MVLGFLAVAYLPLGLVGSWAYGRAARGYEEQVGQNVAAVAHQVRGRVTDGIAVADQQLGVWTSQYDAGAAPPVAGQSFNIFALIQKRFRSFLAGQRELLPLFSSILCVGVGNGGTAKVLYASEAAKEGREILPGFWRSGDYGPEMDHRHRWGGVGSLAVLGPSPFDAQLQVLPIARDYKDHQGSRVALVGLVDWNAVQTLISGMSIAGERLEVLARRRDSFVALFDGQGRFLGGVLPPGLQPEAFASAREAFAGSNDEFRQIVIPGFGTAFAGLSAGADGFSAVAFKDAASALLPIRRLRDAMLLAGTVVLLLILGLGFSISARITAPVKALVGATQVAAGGNLQTSITVTERNEIGELAVAFNAMIVQLRESFQHLGRQNEELRVLHAELEGVNQVLEAKVAERTRNLLESNEKLRESLQRLESAQERLIRSETLAGLGTMAAGIAHELNNALNGVGANLPFIKKQTDQLFGALVECMRTGTSPIAAEKLEQMLDDAEKISVSMQQGVDRSHVIIQNLLVFESAAKPGEGNYRLPTDLRGLIDSALAVHAHRYSDVSVQRLYAAEVPPVPCDPAKLTQVFNNILSNAFLSLGKQGEVIIRTVLAGNKIQVAIEDNGCGIAEEKLPRIFEPFFTDRDVGQGAGLGLSVAYAFVHEHQGEIKVQSQVGKGSTFIVELPLQAPETTAAAPRGAAAEA
jgi:signal transduction histidine kinase